MKAFYDLYVMSRSMAFERATLSNAIHATFDRRQTTLPVTAPVALTDEFATDTAKLAQWRGFVGRIGGDESRLSLPDVIAGIRGFLLPLVDAAQGPSPDRTVWTPASGWHRPSSGETS
jgi:hypothetical protein